MMGQNIPLHPVLKGAFVRTVTPLLLAAGLVISLAACSPATTATDPDCAVTPSGSASDAVKVTGDFGAAPEVEFPTPTEATETERSVVIAGDGDTVKTGETVLVEYTLFNGTSGDQLDASPYDGDATAEFTVDEAQLLPGIVKTMNCSAIGSRIVGVIPAVDAFGETGQADLGVEATDSLVFVIDLVEVKPAPEAPVPEEWTDNVPTVDLSSGTPVVTIPDADPPTSLVIDILEEGDGDVVAAGDSVEVNYQGTSWDTGEIFDQSYGSAPATFATTDVIQGFGAALVGQKVGTKLIVGIPPEYAYGTDPEGHELGGQTLLFVVEILGIS